MDHFVMMRLVDAGCFINAAAGRIGRWTKLPEQLGQTKFNLSEHVRQKVHSKLQI